MRRTFFAVCLAWLLVSGCGIGLTPLSLPVVEESNIAFVGLDSVSHIGKDNVRLNWTGVEGATAFRAYNVTSGTPLLITTASATSTSQTVTGLSPSTAYRFRVRLVDAEGREDANTQDIAATTSAQTDLGNLPDTSSLKGWWIASTGIHLSRAYGVEQWDDQSGNGFHFSQASLSAQPFFADAVVNQKPALLFSGSQWLDGNFTLASSAHTIFIVLKRGAGSATPQSLLRDVTATGLIYSLSTSPYRYSVIGGTGGTYESDLIAGGTFEVATFSTTEVAAGNVDIRTWRNGVAAASLGTLSGVPSTSPGIQMGAASGLNTYLGHIAEVILYSKELDDTSRQKITERLMTDYAISR